jgi:hypothetical protein
MCAQPAGSRPGSVLMQGGTAYSSIGSESAEWLADLTAVLTTAHATFAVGAG